MTVEEYEALRVDMEHTSGLLLPLVCHCGNCVAMLSTVSAGDVIGFYIERKLLEEFNCFALSGLLARIIDKKSAQ